MAEQIVGLAKLQRRLDAIASKPERRKSVRGIVITARHEARASIKRRTGKTARRVKVGRITAASGQLVGSGALVILEGGAKVHQIAPRRRRALAFASQHQVSQRFGGKAKLRTTSKGSLTKGSQKRFGSGAFAVVRSVRHPGLKPRRVLWNSALAAVRRNEIKAQLVGVWNAAA